jgi:hypothetical protein
MPDLNALFQNLGPTGASLMSGIQQGEAINEQRSQEALRQAQMNEIMQRTQQTQAMNPLELQAKQQAIASADMKAKQEKNAYRDELLTRAIPEIEKEPPLRRHARLEQIFNQAGLPLDDTDRQAFYNMQPDELVKNIKAKHEFNVKNSPDFMKAMAQEEFRKTSHLEGIRLTGNTQRELEQLRIDAGKYNKNKVATDVGSMLLKANNPTQKAEILESAYYVALDNDDTESASKYLARAKEARQRAAEDAKNRSVGAPGAMYDPTQSVIVNKPSPTANAPIGGSSTTNLGTTRSGATYTIQQTP